KRPVDVAKWSEREGHIEPRICHITVQTNKGNKVGTGFLVARDIVMTNYHVVEPQIAAREGKTTAQGLTGSPEGVLLRFDYKKSADGTVTNPGREVRLNSKGDWLLDYSPYSPLDEQPQHRHAARGSDELDFALLRLDGAVGEDSLGAGAMSYQRGWLTPTDSYDLQQGEPLIIMQHPRGRPLEIAGDSLFEMNEGRTRITYRTNTEPGSSGSPCFTFNWDLVALHHFGDKETPFHSPEYNQGIPFDAILKRMESKGSRQYLGKKFD
nr:serine protease [Chloroflexota bacterium]